MTVSINSYKGDLKQFAFKVSHYPNYMIYDENIGFDFGYWICNKCRETAEIGVKLIHKKSCNVETGLPGRLLGSDRVFGKIVKRTFFYYPSEEMVFVWGKNSYTVPLRLEKLNEMRRVLQENLMSQNCSFC